MQSVRFSSEAQLQGFMSCHDQRVTAPPELTGPRVRLVACAPEHHARLREIHLEPEVRRWWQDPADDFPASMNRSINYTVMLDERVIGFAQWYSEAETIIRFAGLDLFLDPAVHGRGLGLETVRVLCAHLIDDHGFHRIVVDPEVENEIAIACLRKAGFRPVGVLREYCATASASGRTAFCLTCSPRSSSAASWRVGMPLSVQSGCLWKFAPDASTRAGCASSTHRDPDPL
jgi:aminoglycoside 6'-N-acetyltransferase